MFKKAYTNAEIEFVMFDNDELVLTASVTEETAASIQKPTGEDDDTPIVPALL